MHKKLVYDKVLKKYFFYEELHNKDSEQSAGAPLRKKPKKSPFSIKLQMLKSYYNIEKQNNKKSNIQNKKEETTTTSDSEFFS
jgi:hypothetical protein